MITKTLLASVNTRLQAKDRKEWNIRARAPTPCPWCLANCPHPHFYNFYSTSCPNHSPPQSYLPVFHFCSMFTSMNVLLRIIVNSCCCCVASVVSDSVRPHRRQPNRLLRPWDSPGKSKPVNLAMITLKNKKQQRRWKLNSHGCLLVCHVAAAAAAASLQLCPTLCDSIDASPPGLPVPGILQARTLEWVAISFSNAWKWKVKMKSLSCVRL